MESIYVTVSTTIICLMSVGVKSSDKSYLSKDIDTEPCRTIATNYFARKWGRIDFTDIRGRGSIKENANSTLWLPNVAFVDVTYECVRFEYI